MADLTLLLQDRRDVASECDRRTSRARLLRARTCLHDYDSTKDERTGGTSDRTGGGGSHAWSP
jgi:hypothetical protein